MNVLAIIPARSGSKSIRHKNLEKVGGKSLLELSISHALESSLVNRVIVSTDSKEYGKVATQAGADVPFLRPKEISGDCSSDFECFDHCLRTLRRDDSYFPDICVHLRPTSPHRSVEIMDKMIKFLMENDDYDSCRTVEKVLHPPFKMWYMDGNKDLTPIVPKVRTLKYSMENVYEPWNQQTELLPSAYLHNGNIDVVRSSVIMDKKSMSGSKIKGFLMDHSVNIDSREELKEAQEKENDKSRT